MYRKLVLSLFMVLLSASITMAQDVDEAKKAEVKEAEAKELSGMSIVGNDEAPKSLYIVPWKSSDIGVETALDMTFTEGDVPIDRDVFKRLLNFYEVSTKK